MLPGGAEARDVEAVLRAVRWCQRMSGGMLIPPGPIPVLVATKPVDFRNYAECTIMLKSAVVSALWAPLSDSFYSA